MAAHFTMKRKRPATELSADQREAFRIFSESKHLAVFGKPGTGKTALRDAFAARYPCVLLGPTGTSVQNVFGAYTIARFLGATVATAAPASPQARASVCQTRMLNLAGIRASLRRRPRPRES